MDDTINTFYSANQQYCRDGKIFEMIDWSMESITLLGALLSRNVAFKKLPMDQNLDCSDLEALFFTNGTSSGLRQKAVDSFYRIDDSLNNIMHQLDSLEDKSNIMHRLSFDTVNYRENHKSHTDLAGQSKRTSIFSSFTEILSVWCFPEAGEIANPSTDEEYITPHKVEGSGILALLRKAQRNIWNSHIWETVVYFVFVSVLCHLIVSCLYANKYLEDRIIYVILEQWDKTLEY
jgi:hypothetical protein